MSKLKISLDDLYDDACQSSPEKIADDILEQSADWVYVMVGDDADCKRSKEEGVLCALQNHPELVGAHAVVSAISRLEITYQLLGVEQLRLLDRIEKSLSLIAKSVSKSSTEGKHRQCRPGVDSEDSSPEGEVNE